MLSCMEDNEARLSGIVSEGPTLSHVVHGERFFRFSVKSKRLSENEDTIVVTTPESLLENDSICEGDMVAISGQFRSYNNYSGVGNKLVLTLFAKVIEKLKEPVEIYNEVFLNGYVCKEIIYRVTPFGREIADVLLAVNRAYNKSDYIPCIAWGRNARRLKNVPVGTNLKISGRMQSRQYDKKINEFETEKKIAFEVSVSKVEIVE